MLNYMAQDVQQRPAAARIPIYVSSVAIVGFFMVSSIASFTGNDFFYLLFGDKSIFASGSTLAQEAESSVLSGSTVVKTDSLASNGSYIQFGQAATAPTPTPTSSNFQPSAPYYATFYYPWMRNPNTDNGWAYWEGNGHTPPNNWFSHFVPDPKPGVFEPANELYSANNDSIIYWQLSKLAEAKQEVAISSWWNPNERTDVSFRRIIKDVMNRADNPYPNLRWAIYYEKEGFGNPSVSEIVSDLNYIKTNYTSEKSFFKIDGKPVIFVYGDGSDGAETAARWGQVRQQTGYYVVLKVFSGFASVSPQPDSWHQYAPAVRKDAQGPYYMVSPGFWLEGQSERLARNAGEFETVVKSMVASNATWKLTETWNEWGEGTSVEPGQQVNQTTSGTATLKSDGYPFGNLYVDILSRNLPVLEKGTGR